jgi:antitoxin component of RelBE/YafQ-DinJ toxin-antitoxin module
MHEPSKKRDAQSALLTVRMSHDLKSRVVEIAKAAKLSPSTVAKNILESILERVDNRLDVSADRARILQLERSAEEAKALWRQRVKEVEEYARSVAEKLEAAGLIKRIEPRLEEILKSVKPKGSSRTRGKASRPPKALR